MLTAGGGVVRVGGFRRRELPDSVAGVAPVDLGVTGDMRLVQRVRAVLRNLILRKRARGIAHGADVLIARNLESLAIAASVRKSGQRLVYECLDIHRLLLGTGAASRLLRAIESRLLAQVDLIVTSSPAFAEDYFRAYRHQNGPILLVENKVVVPDGAVPVARRSAGPPWRIAWLGILRCRKSLLQLRAIAEAAAGALEVVIAGRVAYASVPDFDEQVAACPYLRFVGAYRAEDLPRLYGDVHFAWVIDYYEEGLNSNWLLPNRLYESLAWQAVPLALSDVETGRWLERAGVGRTLADPVDELPGFFRTLDADRYAKLRAPVDAVPAERVTVTPAECDALVATVAGRARR